jgi:glycosyltransferase involved in cell wall biosynthesis
MRILKSKENSRNILFITHKEYVMLTGRVNWSTRHWLLGWPEYLIILFKYVTIGRWVVNKILKKNYIVIVHWGFVVEHARNAHFVSMHIADNVTADALRSDGGLALNLTSKDFTPDISFQNKYVDRRYDLITVSHNSRRKRLDKLLECIREVKNEIPDLTALLIINTPSKAFRKNTARTEINFLKVYYTNFTYKERQDVVLIRASDEQELEGLSSSFVYQMMGKSDNFVLFSQQEGAAKVVKEAVEMGCHAWVWADLKGGTVTNISTSDYTSYENDRDFINSISNFILKNRPNGEYKSLSTVNYEAVDLLYKFMKENKILDEKPNYDDFEYANKWLPAHHPDDIRKYSAKVTSDFVSFRLLLNLWRLL